MNDDIRMNEIKVLCNVIYLVVILPLQDSFRYQDVLLVARYRILCHLYDLAWNGSKTPQI